jgi:hypothetical protein
MIVFCAQAEESMAIISDQAARYLLDVTQEQLLKGKQPVAVTIGRLMSGLTEARSRMTAWDWKKLTRGFVQRHPVHQVLLEDPFTRRAFEKPRGYAGDPETIDYTYGLNDLSGVSELGRSILQCTANGAFARAARFRRDALARSIDDVASRSKGARILVLGCGHLREVHESRAVRENLIAEIVAIDHDPETLGCINGVFPSVVVRPAQQSILDLDLRMLGLFDLVYIPGVYDYLWQGAARHVAECASSSVAAAGSLVVANVMPGVQESAYMEAVMDWWLVYRTTGQLVTVTQSVLRAEPMTLRVQTDPDEVLAIVEIRRCTENRENSCHRGSTAEGPSRGLDEERSGS